MGIPGNFQTTAMGILPHTDVEKALELAMGLDIPFWPQLPKVRYEEDMYAQVAERFPGSFINKEKKRVEFNLETFYEDLEEYLFNVEDPHFFQLTRERSLVLHLFLEKDLRRFPAIRGQMEGPISFGLVVKDEKGKEKLTIVSSVPIFSSYLLSLINCIAIYTFFLLNYTLISFCEHYKSFGLNSSNNTCLLFF